MAITTITPMIVTANTATLPRHDIAGRGFLDELVFVAAAMAQDYAPIGQGSSLCSGGQHGPDKRAKHCHTIGAAVGCIYRAFGMWHKTQDPAIFAQDTGDIVA